MTDSPIILLVALTSRQVVRGESVNDCGEAIYTSEERDSSLSSWLESKA
jgi:hypothetical protein